MKIKLNKLFFSAIILSIISTQGVLTFIIFKSMGNWELKKLIHPLSFVIVCFLFMFKKIKKVTVTIVDLLFIIYFLLLFVLLLFNSNSFQSLYISFREVYFLFILIFIYEKVELDESKWFKLVNFLFYLLVLNILFIGLTYILGPEKYMKLITGRYNWGIDPEYKFQITNFSKFWRSPALIGNSASVGFFSVLTYFLMDQNKRFKKKKYLTLIPLVFSFVRSAYLIFIIYEILKFFTKKKNLKKLILVFKIGIPLTLLTLFFLAKSNVLSMTSLYERVRLWSTKTIVDYNVFFGGAIGNVGGGARGQGFIETLDSYWLFLLFSSGLLGILLVMAFLYLKAKNNNKFIFILIAFFLCGFVVNLSQSIVFITIFPLLFLRIKKSELTTEL